METAAFDALEYSQQSQLTQTQQTQPLSQPTTRFPPNLWGILVSVGRSSSESFALAQHAHDHSATVRGDTTTSAPLPGLSTGVHTALPRPERLEFSRTKREYTVGRHPRCDLVLNGPKISSKHARIWLDNETGIVRLEDTSTNGTFVRNMKVRCVSPTGSPVAREMRTLSLGGTSESWLDSRWRAIQGGIHQQGIVDKVIETHIDASSAAYRLARATSLSSSQAT